MTASPTPILPSTRPFAAIMSNTILSRPLRPLSSSFNSCLRGSTNATTPSVGAITSTSAKTTSASTSSTSHGPASITPPLTQRRYAGTTRRHNNMLKSVPSAPIFTPHSSVASDTIIYNPPSAAPNVYHTPLKFLPANDRRRQLAAVQARIASQSASKGASPITRTGTQLSAPSGYNATLNSLASSYGHSSSSASSTSPTAAAAAAAKLPPPLRQPYEKKYHLTERDIAEIRRLRASDPVKWSRQKLADKFECSQFFIGLVAPAPEHAQRKADEIEEIKRRWGPRRRAAREDRKRRKEMWGRGA
ncbi:mitochondrial ribosomal protein subunit L20-domain-containing protein [Phyllosticta citriasiana]|uniref:Mitochondrial ribosomal protein subunit L20-domain-containing protein n=1 Tax=Phyllosticta citriasiana TaxID=595635 RepID=A0ABR1KWK3_9PEZI